MPSFSAPKLDAPSMPSFKAPSFDMPKAPSFDMPKMDAPKLDAPKLDMPKFDAPSMPSFSASPPRVNRRGAVDATRRRLGALDSLIALRAGSQARRPLHAVVLDAEIRRESQCA